MWVYITKEDVHALRHPVLVLSAIAVACASSMFGVQHG